MRKAIAKEIEMIMEKNKDVILLFGDLGFSLFDDIRKKFPNRAINVGISEQAMISIAAGLAKTGKVPIVYSIVPFLIYRPFEQILLDVAYHKLPVVFIGSSEGFSYGEEGISHFALHDLALMLQLPTIDVYTPCESQEAREYLLEAINNKKPAYIRLSKLKDPNFKTKVVRKDGYVQLFAGSEIEIVVLSIGGISLEVEKIIEDIKRIENIAVFHVGRIRQINKEIVKICLNSKKIIVIEEHYFIGGVGSYLALQFDKKVERIALENPFTKDIGKRDYMLTKNFLDKDNILKKIIRISTGNDL